MPSSLFVLNAPILTEYGKYNFRKAELKEVKYLLFLWQGKFISAIGHQSTANLMIHLVKFDIPVNRVQIKMQPGDMAIIFRVLRRLPEGKVLTQEELSEIPYEFGILQRLGF